MIEYNNGFITAMGLFCNHGGDNWGENLALYAGKDHIIDIEQPVKDEILESLIDLIFEEAGNPFLPAPGGEKYYFKKMAEKFNEYAQTDEVIIEIDGVSAIPQEILEYLPIMDKIKYELNVVVKRW